MVPFPMHGIHWGWLAGWVANLSVGFISNDIGAGLHRMVHYPWMALEEIAMFGGYLI